MNKETIARFWELVDKRGRDECWPWLGRRAPKGYGRFDIGARYLGISSRIALELYLGRKLRPGMQACHICDNPPCCNSLHLFE